MRIFFIAYARKYQNTVHEVQNDPLTVYRKKFLCYIATHAKNVHR